MEQTASVLQALDRGNEAPMTEDSSAQTIEFLRARLLAERAASKAARKEAQEISEKVKALNAQLEAEVENRKAAEAAMGRVFTILKAKGLQVEDLVSEHQVESAGPTVDDVKEMNKGPEDCFSSASMDNGDGQGPSHSPTESYAHTEESPPSQNRCEVQLALRDKPMVYTDKPSTTCMPNSEDNLLSSQASEKGSSIAQKLKAMLQQIEEEVITLPTEQEPLKLELQSCMNHVARVLEKESKAALGRPVFDDGTSKAAANSSFKDTVASKNETNTQSDNNGASYPPTVHSPSAGRDSASLPSKMRHIRRSSCGDSLEFWREPVNKLMPPQLMKNGISLPVRYPDNFTPNSPRRLAALSVGDTSFLQAGLQQYQGRGIGLEGPATYNRDNPLQRQWSSTGPRSGQLLSRSYVVDVCDEPRMTKDRYVDPRHIPLNKGHVYPHRPYTHAVRDAAAENAQCPPTSVPPNDAAAPSPVDLKKGQLGDILMALDAARQCLGDEEQMSCTRNQLFGASTAAPIAEKTKLKGGYPCGDDHTWRSPAPSQVPIIPLPPSLASEHGYSSFERHSRHRRSSSLLTNWQCKGEVHLGNGITLYTD